jgi:hypothetical protein
MMTAFLRNAGSCVPKLRVVAFQVSVLSHYEFYSSRDVILSIFITSPNRALHLLPITILFNSINLKEGLKNIILPKKKKVVFISGMHKSRPPGHPGDQILYECLWVLSVELAPRILRWES